MRIYDCKRNSCLLKDKERNGFPVVTIDNKTVIIRNGYDKEAVESKATDYFMPFDYIVGDWAYGKLRLKGFYDKSNKKCREINNIEFLDKYLKDN